MGSVNDVAFSHPDKSLSIVTCGEDKTIKVSSRRCALTYFIREPPKKKKLHELIIFLLHRRQVWDATTGQKRYNFEGHDAPVYSVCARRIESIEVRSVLVLVLLYSR